MKREPDACAIVWHHAWLDKQAQGTWCTEKQAEFLAERLKGFTHHRPLYRINVYLKKPA